MICVVFNSVIGLCFFFFFFCMYTYRVELYLLGYIGQNLHKKLM